MNIHFVGIMGVSMSKLADICKRRGDRVTGSDLAIAGHRAENVRGADLVVYTGAAADDNPELVEARRLHIPIVSRAEMLGNIAASYPYSVAVAGCHGKTTATALTGLALKSYNPEVHVGGDYGFPAGSGVFVTEACEYRRSFLRLKPDVAVILNVGLDHTDCYKDLDDIYAAFSTFAGGARQRIVNGDDPLCRAIGRAKTFGLGENCNYRAVGVCDRGGLSFELLVDGKPRLAESLPLVGIHNVHNVLAAYAVADTVGLPLERARIGMSGFRGVKRRFERLGERDGAAVFTDYAHHPRELDAALKAARSMTDGRVLAVFEPHTFTRTASFRDDFVRSLSAADAVVLAPVYAAREKPLPGVCSQDLCIRLKKTGRPAACFDTYAEINAYIEKLARPGDLVLYLGAGTINKAGENLVSRRGTEIPLGI